MIDFTLKKYYKDLDEDELLDELNTWQKFSLDEMLICFKELKKRDMYKFEEVLLIKREIKSKLFIWGLKRFCLNIVLMIYVLLSLYFKIVFFPLRIMYKLYKKLIYKRNVYIKIILGLIFSPLMAADILISFYHALKNIEIEKNIEEEE